MASKSDQTSFTSDQNFNIDIEELYKDFVTGDPSNTKNVSIDDIRSQINISILDQDNKRLIDSLNIDDTAQKSNITTTNVNTPSKTAQESRCHTFYRIIGFPVVGSNKDFYNPGYDPITSLDLTSNRKVNRKKKLSIAKDPIANFNNLSKARENWVNNNLTIFSTPETIEASTFCLTSGTYSGKSDVNLRKFISPFDKNNSSDPFDMNIENQSYSLGSKLSISIGNHTVPLSDLQDASGIKPTTDNVKGGLKQHYHIITPFTVDPRIDFSVYPIDSPTASGVSKRIAVPFVKDQTQLRISTNAYCERPLLEKILIDRFSQDNQKALVGLDVQNMINYVSNIKSIQKEDIIKQISSGNIYQKSEQANFAKYISIIQAMMNKLVDSMRIVHRYQGYYYFLPIPSKSGPEGGCFVRPVVQPNANSGTDTNSNLVTQNDYQIILANARAIFNKQNNTPPNTQADVGNFTFSAFKMTFGDDTSNALGNIIDKSLESLVDTRSRILTQACDALKTIEMIMGEFSGFGLCDIIAIIASLYIMDKQLLLEFLDDDSLNRMNIRMNANFEKGTDPSNNLTKAMAELNKTVKSFYSIMQQIYLDYVDNNALNV